MAEQSELDKNWCTRAVLNSFPSLVLLLRLIGPAISGPCTTTTSRAPPPVMLSSTGWRARWIPPTTTAVSSCAMASICDAPSPSPSPHPLAQSHHTSSAVSSTLVYPAPSSLTSLQSVASVFRWHEGRRGGQLLKASPACIQLILQGERGSADLERSDISQKQRSDTPQ